jgi:hypothetical protein
MLNDFLVAIGARRPSVEVWQCPHLVIVDDDGKIIWCRPGVIEYKPMPEQYWGGVGQIFDAESDEPRFTYMLDRIAHQDENSYILPMFGRRTGRRGAKIQGRDADGNRVVLYIGQHALNYIAAHGLVESMPPMEPWQGDDAGIE